MHQCGKVFSSGGEGDFHLWGKLRGGREVGPQGHSKREGAGGLSTEAKLN